MRSIMTLAWFLTALCGAAEFEYEMIREENGAILYGHYVESERVFKIYDHKNNRLRNSYIDVDRKQLNIIGKRKVTIANPVAEGGVWVDPVILAMMGVKKKELADVYISRWELSDGLAQYHLKIIVGGPPRDGDASGIGVIVFESDKTGFVHVVTYRRNADEDMVKIDEFDHSLAGGMIYSGRLKDDQMTYLGGADKEIVVRKLTLK